MENHAAAAIDYTYSGAHGWREWMADLFEPFTDGASYSLNDVIAVGDDFLAATYCVAGRSVWSGNALQFSWAAVTWFRADKATRVLAHASPAAALRVATCSHLHLASHTTRDPTGPP
jgi:hypothetical protein